MKLYSHLFMAEEFHIIDDDEKFVRNYGSQSGISTTQRGKRRSRQSLSC